MSIKKQFAEIAAILEANANKKVSTVMPELMELMSKKNNASGQANTFIKDDAGNVVAVFCYYHKKWELVAECEYGKKANTATGLNTMCKEGVSQWTKQSRAKKKANEAILDQVASGKLKVEEIGQAQREADQQFNEIVARQDGHGFDTVEELKLG